MREISQSDFAKAAARQTDRGVVAECWYFLWFHRAWWLLPVVLMLLLLGVFLVLSQTAAGPFLYTLF